MIRSLLLSLAAWIARRYGLELVVADRVDDAILTAHRTTGYVLASGHLTRAYHAGHYLRDRLAEIRAALDSARRVA